MAIRALAHFSLCNSYGLPYSHNGGNNLGVPIVTTLLAADAKIPRNSVAEVYTQIISDLTTAIPLLKGEKNVGKINVWAAKTLLARIYLYKEDNDNAYATAVDVINNNSVEEEPHHWLSPFRQVDNYKTGTAGKFTLSLSQLSPSFKE